MPETGAGGRHGLDRAGRGGATRRAGLGRALRGQSRRRRRRDRLRRRAAPERPAHAQAVAVLQQAAIRNPKDLPLLAAYGKALADTGRYKEASEVLARAHLPEKPDWRILSAQGAVADQLGDHSLAQRYYEAALKIAPGEPTVLSNLGLSYAFSKRLADAEKTLRAAAATP